jgi:hypothetical protein
MRKVEIVKVTKIKLPDWSKKNWVQNFEDRTAIIATTGEHKDNGFSGYCLPCEAYPKGEFFNNWPKKKFILLEDDIPFVISNKEK